MVDVGAMSLHWIVYPGWIQDASKEIGLDASRKFTDLAADKAEKSVLAS